MMTGHSLLRTTNLPLPHQNPSEELLHRAHSRLILLIKALAESGGISSSTAYDAPQDAILAHQEGEYDTLYYMLKYLGFHDLVAITRAVQDMRVDGVKNTGPELTQEKMNAASSVRDVILDLWRSRTAFADHDVPHYAYIINNIDEKDKILEIMARGVLELPEIASLLEQKRRVEPAFSSGMI